MTATYTVSVAYYACDDGIAEWNYNSFANRGDAQEFIDQLDSYEEHRLTVNTDTDDSECPF